jgi:hypothetical protein
MKRASFLLLVAALAGCMTPDSEETGRNTSPPVVLTFAPTPKKATATLHIGDEVQFVLPAARGPSFVWQIVSDDPRCLRQFKGVTANTGVASAAGTTTISFIAQRPSRSYVRFAYVPTGGGKETDLVDGYEVLVTVKP